MGVFIKLSQEKVACGGQRAICLCHTQMTAAKSSGAPAKPMLSQNSNSNKEAVSQSGGSHHYVAYNLPDLPALSTPLAPQTSIHLYSLLICKSIEHIPK